MIFRLRVGIVVDGDMPLATVPRAVAVGPKRFRKRCFINAQSSAIPRRHERICGPVRRSWLSAQDMGLLQSRWVLAADHRATARCTSRCWRIGLPKQHASLCQRVNVRRFERRTLVHIIALHVLPAEVVGIHQDNIGLLRTR